MDNKNKETKSTKSTQKKVQKKETVVDTKKYSVHQAAIIFSLSSLNRAVLFAKHGKSMHTQEQWKSILKKENLNFKNS